MKSFILASLLVVAVRATLLEEDGVHFQSFKLKHGKTYKNQAEETKRFAIFRENLHKIKAHNAEYEQGIHTYTQAVNKFADMTHDEFKVMLATQVKSKPDIAARNSFHLADGVSVPKAIDWRSYKAVTDIKDQGSCGSCWAFSVIGTLEGAYALSTGNLTRFSEQQLVDCTRGINNGCRGGWEDSTFPYIQEHGIELESDYPYTGVDGTCYYDASKVVTKVSSYVLVQSNEEALKEAVGTVGPISIAINANALQFYSSGIVNDLDCDPTYLNHGVLAVGYDSEGDQDYWTIKNSWGPDWGESGYFRFLRGYNICGVKEDAVYPLI